MRIEISKPIELLGMALPQKTSNANGQSAIDCKNLWHAFEDAGLASQIPNKLNDAIYGVYYDYDGDSNHPFSYFIGCAVAEGTVGAASMQALTIPAGQYDKIIINGKMPDCVMNAWTAIWKAAYPRGYAFDFEVYDERSKDWNRAEVDIYLSLR